MTQCVGCGKSALLLRDDDRAPSIVCDGCATVARRRAQTAERVRRYKARKRLIRLAFGDALDAESVTLVAARKAREVLAKSRRNKRYREKVKKRSGQKKDASETSPSKERPTHCDCGRALNLGRYKTEGDTCGTCKKEAAQKERDKLPWYVSPEELARQLEDWTPLEDDDE